MLNRHFMVNISFTPAHPNNRRFYPRHNRTSCLNRAKISTNLVEPTKVELCLELTITQLKIPGPRPRKPKSAPLVNYPKSRPKLKPKPRTAKIVSRLNYLRRLVVSISHNNRNFIGN